MKAVHLPRTSKDRNGTVECIREFALKNNLGIKELDEDQVDRLQSRKPSFNEITWFYVPPFSETGNSKDSQNVCETSRQLAILFGSHLRFVTVSDITEQLLCSMVHSSSECCICQEMLAYNNGWMSCNSCNVYWCMTCQATLKGRKRNLKL